MTENKSGKLKFREILSYGLADFGQIALMQLSSIYLLYFYTDVLAVSAGIIGTIFLLSRLWDAINDPLMGLVVDHTYTRFGRCRPYLIPASVILALSAILMFSDPGLSGTGLVVFIIITYNLFNMAFTATNLPLTAQLPLMTADYSDRLRLSSVRAFFQSVAYASIPLLVEFFFTLYGRREASSSYTVLACIVGVIMVALFVDAFRHTRERVYLKPERIRLPEIRSVFLQGRAWLLILAANILITLALISRTTSAIYHFQNVVGSLAWFGLFMTLSTIAMIPLSLLATRASARMGKRNFAQAGCAVGVLGHLLIAWQPLDPAMLMTGSLLSGCAVGTFISVLFAIEGDIADEAHARTGIRAQGIVCSVIALGYKIGLGLGAGIVGWLLGAAQYDGTKANQPTAVLSAIEMSFIWIPLLATVLAMILLAFYTLEKELPDINRSLLGITGGPD